MTMRDIVLWPDTRLTELCARIAAITPEIETLATDMLETMYDAPGRGLAGPQVGAMQRIFVMDTEWKEGSPAPMVFINPEIETCSKTQAVQGEGCLSIPGVAVEVSRPAEVTLRWTDLAGKAQRRMFSGFAAACVQHELDHLNGIVTLDHLTEAARASVEADYADTLS
ncbi:peptide deformylase [uncultured Roseobacter sp.]|uniref:peptide deformylase n=1 Tax=uncultured Roseobacter sp. TaxID=114847 RepID=UPI00262169EA|nr:peptide deformylase [uncultured Roseobacter sp.]